MCDFECGEAGDDIPVEFHRDGVALPRCSSHGDRLQSRLEAEVPSVVVAGGLQSGATCSSGHQSGMRGKSMNFRQRSMPPSSHHWLARQLREPAA